MNGRTAIPVVDLRDISIDSGDITSADPWQWSVEYTKRLVRRRFPDATGLRGTVIKHTDPTRGTDLAQLAQVLEALDEGRPVAFCGWWPSATTASTTTTLGVDVLDVPPPDRKGSGLADGHAVVLVGYARHDAFPGGGYFVVRGPESSGGAGDGESGYLPFTYVRAYATSLWTAEPEAGRPVGVPTGDLPVADDAHLAPGGAGERELKARARCADPRSSYTALFFSENPFDTLRAKAICSVCTVKAPCLSGALARREPYGVWGGEFLVDGAVVAVKRGRGRPSLVALPIAVDEVTGAPVHVAVAVA